MAEPWLVFQLPEIDLRLNMEINDKQKTIRVIIELNYARTDDDGASQRQTEHLHERLVVVSNLLNVNIVFGVDVRL